MSKFDKLPRGFKANSERISIEYRRILGKSFYEPLCGFELSNHLDIEICKPEEFFGEGIDITPLIGSIDNPSGWSALTMKGKTGKKIIIHNPVHSINRQQSDLMHELAHSICRHEKPDRFNGLKLPFFMREHDEQQEQEATYLGGALQLPRQGLVWCKNRGMSLESIATYFDASKEMVRFRINITGVGKQYRRRGSSLT